jgi:hypothetical protein
MKALIARAGIGGLTATFAIRGSSSGTAKSCSKKADFDRVKVQ